jgi:hypothetical protein
VLLLLAGLCLAVAGCRPAPVVTPSEAWTYADLRILSPASANLPSLDLIALYTRTAGGDLQIRLDLLDLALEPDGDLYLALDWTTGGRTDLPFDAGASLAWDILLVLPVHGQPYALAPASSEGGAFSPFPALIPRISRVPWQDMIVVSFNPNALPGVERGFSLQAYITPAGGSMPADSLGPVRSDARPPGRAPVLLAFWNTFPAYTPAQALRRWDGAHTGPFGGRHGLHVLLQAARRARVPLVLLDLKTPESLSALDYLGGLSAVQELAGLGLLTLPDALPGSPSLLPSPQALPGWAVARSAGESRLTGADFGLEASPILYSPSLELLEQVTPAAGLPPFAWIVAPLPDSSSGGQPLRWKTYRLLPLPPASKEHQATPDGLSIELRKALLANVLAASQTEPPLLVLGGDLVDSVWGEPESSRATLLYIAAHPWIQPYGQAELLNLRPGERLERPSPAPGAAPFAQTPAGSESPPASPDAAPLFSTGAPQESMEVSLQWIGQLAESLNSPAFDKTLARAAWQNYRSLFAPLPPEHPQLPALRAGYAAYPALLLEAAGWAARPENLAHCNLVLDLDGRAGCILASERIFSVYDPLGGRLLALFAYSPAGDLHQLVAPTSQFIVGFGDPSTWDPSAGPGAEPAGVHGAFAGSPPPWEAYSSEVSAGRLAFTSPDGRVSKTFTLLENGVRVDYSSPVESLRVQVPLALDPWERFTPGWGDRFLENGSDQAWSWGIEGGPLVDVRTSGDLSATLFSDSRSQLGRVEDPNFSYPPGHYLPFPLAVVEVQAGGDFNVEITLRLEK